MDLNLKESRIIVAGGSSGIGLAVSRLLLAEGARVAIVGRDEARLQAARDVLTPARDSEETHGSLDGGGGREEETPSSGTSTLLTIAGDVTEPAEARRAVKLVSDAWDGVDGLVDAVGQGHRGLLRDLTAEEWEQNWRVNVLQAALLAQATSKEMSAQGSGSMVFLGAASGKQPTEGQLVSNVHKAGLMAFVTTLASELAPAGIRVNLVCPGRSMSPRRHVKARQVAEEQGTTVELYFQELSASVPLGRLAEPEEVAAMAVFLCSPRASYITGQSISVDGGMVRAII